MNTQTATNWQAYVNQLTAAGVAPRRAALRDPLAGLPAGLVPVAASSGGAQAGAARSRGSPPRARAAGRDPRAVSAAMTTLGTPYAPGTAGPSPRTAARWSVGLRRRRDLLPGDPAGPVRRHDAGRAADVLPGDLVFLGTTSPASGTSGIALDPKTMLAADARAGAVVVRTLPADQVLGIGRPSLGAAGAGRRPGTDGRRAARWSAATPSTRPATTAPGSGAATPTA